MHSMGYGRTSAADGRVFPYIFNFPGTYWDAASIIVKHIIELHRGSVEVSSEGEGKGATFTVRIPFAP